eukprot:GHVO01011685.1.p1 GENE.GHVO01011685.1~~GHVO01011685.1.p1  ORF type:complete len:191 (-),score=52.16 GHVO01011685.1:45-617(-)
MCSYVQHRMRLSDIYSHIGQYLDFDTEELTGYEGILPSLEFVMSQDPHEYYTIASDLDNENPYFMIDACMYMSQKYRNDTCGEKVVKRLKTLYRSYEAPPLDAPHYRHPSTVGGGVEGLLRASAFVYNMGGSYDDRRTAMAMQRDARGLSPFNNDLKKYKEVLQGDDHDICQWIYYGIRGWRDLIGALVC